MRTVVIIESPYRGRGVEAIRYLACCYLDSLDRGECPIATHSQYPLALDESDESRAIGKECHAALCRLLQIHDLATVAHPLRILYCDLSEQPSSGMMWNHAETGDRSLCRHLQGRAKEIWKRGEWPTKARWA